MYDAVMVYYKALRITMSKKNQDTRNGITVMENAKYLTIKSKHNWLTREEGGYWDKFRETYFTKLPGTPLWHLTLFQCINQISIFSPYQLLIQVFVDSILQSMRIYKYFHPLHCQQYKSQVTITPPWVTVCETNIPSVFRGRGWVIFLQWNLSKVDTIGTKKIISVRFMENFLNKFYLQGQL